MEHTILTSISGDLISSSKHNNGTIDEIANVAIDTAIYNETNDGTELVSVSNVAPNTTITSIQNQNDTGEDEKRMEKIFGLLPIQGEELQDKPWQGLLDDNDKT